MMPSVAVSLPSFSGHIKSGRSRQSPSDEASEAQSACRKEEEDADLEEDGEDDEQLQGKHQNIKKSSTVKSKSKRPRLIF